MTTAQKVIKYIAIAFAIFLIVSIISGILTAIFGISTIFGIKVNDNRLSENLIGTTFENKDIKNLEIEVAYSNLIIKKDNELKVETNNSQIECKQINNKLYIKEESHNWFNRNNNIGDLIIYIPDNIELDKAEIVTGAGKINIEELTTDKLELELGAGETQINSLKVNNKATIEGGAGKVSILSSEINNLELDMGVGETTINSKLTGKTEINAGIGNLQIKVNGNKEDYKLKAEKGIGTIKVEGKEISNGNILGNGENSIEIDGGIGSIEVEFE